ncbi:MAG: imidazole glycerol phosphate synthase subunit HisH [Chloroflexi bacterium]|nr:imidazole glycerol phosphate synthase subunit HisH [Chloroflexota bacterium]
MNSVIAVVDYGAGNLRSVVKALQRLEAAVDVTSDPRALAHAGALLLPGVGAAGEAMERLQSLGLRQSLAAAVADGKPFFGVCLGLQLLFERSEESAGPCLGILPGVVCRLRSRLKVPHMGWNQVHQRATHPLFAGIPDAAYFYFVHAYVAYPADRATVIGETDYDVVFPSVLAHHNVVATQFHPEKSGATGLRLYANWLASIGLATRPPA